MLIQVDSVHKKSTESWEEKVVRVNGEELKKGYMEDGFDQYVLYTCNKYSKMKEKEKNRNLI